jgi:DNA mismatch endonuclease (patch repair protein)
MGNEMKCPPYSGDTLSPKERSERMSRVRSKDTKPELFVRRLLSSMGYRYRLHLRSVPGNPDIGFSRRKKAIFVHGCFWHRHKDCPNCRLPKSNLEFWKPKLEGNKKRDAKKHRELKKAGWQILVIWECELNDDRLPIRLRSFLEDRA